MIKTILTIALMGLLSGCAVQSDRMVTIETDAPVFRIFLGDGVHLVLLNDMKYQIPGTNEHIIVPAGFVTDLTSVPDAAGILVPKMGPHTVGSILHDYLYWDQRCGKDKADKLYDVAMREYGFTRAWWAALGVEFGGAPSWNQNRKDKQRGYAKILGPQQIAEMPINAKWADYRQSLYESGYRDPPTYGIPYYCKLIPS